MTDSPQDPKKPLFAIFLIVLVDVLGLTIILSPSAILCRKIWWLASGVRISRGDLRRLSAFSGPFLGRLSDRVGRKPLLIVSQLGTFIGFIILVLRPI